MELTMEPMGKPKTQAEDEPRFVETSASRLEPPK